MTNRRDVLALTAAGLAAATLPARAAAPMRVLAAPGCGCCHAWADVARARGDAASLSDLADPAGEKAARCVPAGLTSCHTVRVDGCVFEGHVPFEAVEAVLRDRPAITGRAAPGLPMGSPGMGDDPAARHDVLAFGGTAAGGTVFYHAGTPAPFDV